MVEEYTYIFMFLQKILTVNLTNVGLCCSIKVVSSTVLIAMKMLT